MKRVRCNVAPALKRKTNPFNTNDEAKNQRFIQKFKTTGPFPSLSGLQDLASRGDGVWMQGRSQQDPHCSVFCPTDTSVCV